MSHDVAEAMRQRGRPATRRASPGVSIHFATRTLPTLTPFFAEARAATPVFYCPDLDYWVVVTRYRDIERIFQTPKLFSAANTLAPLQPDAGYIRSPSLALVGRCRRLVSMPAARHRRPARPGGVRVFAAPFAAPHARTLGMALA